MAAPSSVTLSAGTPTFLASWPLVEEVRWDRYAGKTPQSDWQSHILTTIGGSSGTPSREQLQVLVPRIVHDIDSSQQVHNALVAKLLQAATPENSVPFPPSGWAPPHHRSGRRGGAPRRGSGQLL